ncbi:MAG: M20/M25/M40 family metallo-hydrolase, partial [Gemmatimonadota bacterium]|nr:M20/M25/M40 family metallo-hydrolase [Gemmatimonadota bacterium]
MTAARLLTAVVGSALVVLLGTTVTARVAVAQSSVDEVERYAAEVEWLADDERDGRGLGSAGLEEAGQWIAGKFAEIGLEPAGDDGFRHTFQAAIPDPADPHAEGTPVEAFNVVGRLVARGSDPLPGVIVVGAHYDHLGLGGFGSLDPDSEAIHNGADDNASGTVALIETARRLAEVAQNLRRDVVFVAFSGEERGLLGSSAFVRTLPGGLQVEEIRAMLNMDMVGRLEANRLQVLGGESAEEWKDLVAPLCERLALDCVIQGDGFGSSDHSSFFAAGIPVLHFFTGAHSEYHRPSDDAELINAAGAVRIVQLVAATVQDLADRDSPLTLVESTQPAPTRMRMGGARLGTIPDYAGPADGSPGLLLSAVRSGSPAEQGGLRRGDLIVGIDDFKIDGVEDFMVVLSEA